MLLQEDNSTVLGLESVTSHLAAGIQLRGPVVPALLFILHRPLWVTLLRSREPTPEGSRILKKHVNTYSSTSFGRTFSQGDINGPFTGYAYEFDTRRFEVFRRTSFIGRDHNRLFYWEICLNWNEWWMIHCSVLGS